MVYLLTLLSLNAFAQHDHGSSSGNMPSHNKKANDSHSRRPAIEFQMQLRAVFTASLSLSEALIASDAEKASNSVAEIKTVISEVDMSLLKDEALMDWMISLKTINESLDLIGGSNDLTAQRKSFALFSDALFKSLKTFGSGGAIIYYDYCPMANNNSGAYWLSGSKEIRNPYLGGEKLTCGKVKETVQ